MNRQIKFRGLRTDGKGWAYGDLLQPHDGNPSTYIMQRNGIEVEVRPETIGQFTGLADKNGREIWEGDTVNFTPEKDAEKYILERDWNGVIEWGDSRLAINWIPKIERKDMGVMQYCSNDGLRGLDDLFNKLITVTGNIHEQ